MKNQSKSVTCKCIRCNKPFKAYTEDPHPLCSTCKNTVAITRECKDCGNKFEITFGEQKWYEEKGLCLPVRCPTCRKQRRVQANAD